MKFAKKVMATRSRVLALLMVLVILAGIFSVSPVYANEQPEETNILAQDAQYAEIMPLMGASIFWDPPSPQNSIHFGNDTGEAFEWQRMSVYMLEPFTQTMPGQHMVIPPRPASCEIFEIIPCPYDPWLSSEEPLFLGDTPFTRSFYIRPRTGIAELAGINPGETLHSEISLTVYQALIPGDLVVPRPRYVTVSVGAPDAPFIIEKELLMPEGMPLPDEPIRFEFRSQLVACCQSWRGSLPPPVLELTPTVLEAIFTPPLSNLEEETVDDVDFLVATEEMEVDLSAINWPHPGVYTFRIWEVYGSSDTEDPFHMQYDEREFYLIVFVGRQTFLDDSGNTVVDMSQPLEVLSTSIGLRDPNGDTECQDSLDNEYLYCTCDVNVHFVGEDKAERITFRNIMTQTVTEFAVSKTVLGNLSNPNLDFRFSALFTMPEDQEFPTGTHAIEAQIWGYPRSNDGLLIGQPRVPIGEPVTVTSDVFEFVLRHGDIITFYNVPIGAEFTVTEYYVSGYEQSAVVNEGGTPRADTVIPSDTPGPDLVVTGTVQAPSGEAEPANYVAVTNEAEASLPMGIFLNNAPLFGIFALATLLGVLAFIGFRRRGVAYEHVE